MKLRFIEYCGDIYIVLCITYDTKHHCPECFVAIPISDKQSSLVRTALQLQTLNIPFTDAKEITDKNRLISLMVLYG